MDTMEAQLVQANLGTTASPAMGGPSPAAAGSFPRPTPPHWLHVLRGHHLPCSAHACISFTRCGSWDGDRLLPRVKAVR